MLKFLQVLSLPLEIVLLSVIYISSYRDVILSIIEGSVVSFPLKCVAVNPFYNTLSSFANIGSFFVCPLKRSFTLSFDSINKHN